MMSRGEGNTTKTGDQDGAVIFSTIGTKVDTSQKTDQTSPHQSVQERTTIEVHEGSTPSTLALKDTEKISELKSITDQALIDDSITISRKMFQQLAQKVDACTQATNDKNDEIQAIQKAREIANDERLKEYRATVAELSDKVSYPLVKMEKRDAKDEKIAKFLAEEKRQRDEEKKQEAIS